MKFGLTKDQYEFILETVANPLRAKGSQVYCYGSRARGSHNPFSDLDLMVESDLTEGQLGVPEIQESLQKSNFPYKVDIAHISNFAESYRPSYEKDKVVF